MSPETNTGSGGKRPNSECPHRWFRRYEDIYGLCFLRGPEGIIIGLAEQLT